MFLSFVFVVGRIVFQLFSDICPKTCKNFLSLCTGEFCFRLYVVKCMQMVSTVEHVTGNWCVCIEPSFLNKHVMDIIIKLSVVRMKHLYLVAHLW